MATMNFSIPNDVKEVFNETFSGQNKSAIVSDLMREAIERARRKQLSHEAISRILERRQNAPFLSESEILAVRENERP